MAIPSVTAPRLWEDGKPRLASATTTALSLLNSRSMTKITRIVATGGSSTTGVIPGMPYQTCGLRSPSSSPVCPRSLRSEPERPSRSVIYSHFCTKSTPETLFIFANGEASFANGEASPSSSPMRAATACTARSSMASKDERLFEAARRANCRLALCDWPRSAIVTRTYRR